VKRILTIGLTALALALPAAATAQQPASIGRGSRSSALKKMPVP